MMRLPRRLRGHRGVWVGRRYADRIVNNHYAQAFRLRDGDSLGWHWKVTR